MLEFPRPGFFRTFSVTKCVKFFVCAVDSIDYLYMTSVVLCNARYLLAALFTRKGGRTKNIAWKAWLFLRHQLNCPF